MGEALLTCYVEDGKLHFIKNYSENEIMQIYTQLSEDLLNCNIPHYRVVAFTFNWDLQRNRSVFKQNNIHGKSLIEIAEDMKYVVPKAIGGNDTKAGRFAGETEEFPRGTVLEDSYGYPSSEHKDKRHTRVLKCSHTDIGILFSGCSMPNPETGRLESNDFVNTSKMAFYNDFDEDTVLEKTLVRDKTICRIDCDNTSAKPRILMLFKEGTGRLNYKDTQKLFVPDYERVMVCPTQYDLAQFFTIRYPENNEIEFAYLEDIDEDVLTTILNNYGRKLLS